MRQILIEATRRLMATMPTSDITIREIGREAGVQFSLVNRHFGSRDNLLREAIAQILVGWVGAMLDGPADGVMDRAADYLVARPFDVSSIRLLTVDESTFPGGRSPVVDAIVEYLSQAGRHVEPIDVTAALSLVVGWASARDHWATTADMPVDEALEVVKAHARRCLDGPG